METIYAQFQKIVQAHPEAPAILENNRTLTFQMLSQMVDTIADSFPEKVQSVGIVMRHRAEQIASLFAILKCSARYVPAEPDFPLGRIREMMQESQVDFILTDPALVQKLGEFPLRCPDCAICGDRSGSHRPAAPEDPARSAYVLYTSGTTGRPKGISVSNRNVCHYVRAFAREFHPGPGDIMLQYSVCSFDIFVEEVFASLLNGAALAIPAEEDTRTISSLMAFVQRHDVTMLSGFPYLLEEMNHLPSIPPTLRLLISGGDVLRQVYVGHLLPQATVYNTYGPSETTVCASYFPVREGTALPDGTFPIGHTVQGAEVCILDPEGNPVPDGTEGELWIGGDGVSLGYIGDHEEENKAFQRREDGKLWYRSGDMGYRLPDGNLAFTGRKDNQIMIYGKRVELAEVESRLYQCRNVQLAVVRACTDEDGLPYMTAYLVSSEAPLQVSKIRQELSEHLPAYMIPDYFVQLQEIPLNSSRKPNLAALPVVLKEGKLL